MKQSLSLVSLVVRDIDEALAYYTGSLGFELLEDTPVPAQGKRWVVVAPRGGTGSRLLLACASSPAQRAHVGDQTGGRVFLFLSTDDSWRDFKAYTARGVRFVREPQQAPYGTVAVFADLYGNLRPGSSRADRPRSPSARPTLLSRHRRPPRAAFAAV